MSENSKESAQLAEVEKQISLKPYTHGRLWNEAQNKLEIQMWNAADERCTFELGCRLIEARNNVEPGQWLAYLKECNIDRYKAALYIRVAKRLGDSPRLKSLKAGVSKVSVILQADEEDLEDFERSGILLGKDEDELASMSRQELKDLVRKKDRRLEQSKEQLGELQADNERLQDQGRSKDRFYDDLTDLRRTLFGNLDQFKQTAMGDIQREIAFYTVTNMISIHCAQMLRTLCEESKIENLLQGTAASYDPVHFEMINLEELAQKESDRFSSLDKAHPVELRNDKETD